MYARYSYAHTRMLLIRIAFEVFSAMAFVVDYHMRGYIINIVFTHTTRLEHSGEFLIFACVGHITYPLVYMTSVTF